VEGLTPLPANTALAKPATDLNGKPFATSVVASLTTSLQTEVPRRFARFLQEPVDPFSIKLAPLAGR